MVWGDVHRRDFPWRHTQNPYEILVAELLVQRTRASQVEPVYQNFLQRWPDIRSLAHARERDLKSVIRTLGLAYRVTRIRRLAAQIMRLFGGTIPETLPELERLYGSGFGDYMSHAILSFAFSRDVPVVDKNVERILKRVFSLSARADAHRDPNLWAFAGNLVPAGKSREYNWSLLDFGALACTPRNPQCSACTLLELCEFGKERVIVLRRSQGLKVHNRRPQRL
jgi:A/G-specific adenine glycosylase